MTDFDARLITLDDVLFFAGSVQEDSEDVNGILLSAANGQNILTGTVQHDITGRNGTLYEVDDA